MRSRIGVALLAILALSACVGTAPTNPPPQSTPPQLGPPAATSTVTPRYGGQATIGVVGDLGAINPAFDTTGLAATLLRPVVEGLFDFDASGQPRPWLAESVPTRGRGTSSDGMTVIVRLRQGIAWEDGQAYTAADVLFTLAAARDPANRFAPEIAAAYATIRTADALDPYTVRLGLTAPSADYLRAFSPIFPAHLFNGRTTLATSPYARAPFGTGPFRLAEWTPGASLLLTRSASYRLTGRPYLDTIRFLAFPDQATAEAALREGRIDLLLTADMHTFFAPPGGNPSIRGLDPVQGLPPTWNAAEWWRQEPRR
jgi:peptide/nickel transport system substrate-binding protein